MSAEKAKAIRVKWDAGLIGEALNLLKNHDVKTTAQKLNVNDFALRMALKRNGVSVRSFRQIRAKQRRIIKRAGGGQAFTSANEFSPFIAMRAFEADTGGCRWPIGDLSHDGFRFCCRAIARKSYCAAHAKRAYIKARDIPLNSFEAYSKCESRLRAVHAAQCRNISA